MSGWLDGMEEKKLSGGKVIPFPVRSQARPIAAVNAVEAALQEVAEALAAAPATPKSTRGTAPENMAKRNDGTRKSTGGVVHQSITGNNNTGVIGDNNHVHISVHGARLPRPLLSPGEAEVTNEQAAEIKRLIGTVVDLSGRSYQHVYGVIYRHFEATSYLMIKRHRYDHVVRYLHKWIASVSIKTVPADTEDERKRLLKRLHAQARKNSSSLDNVRSYISGRFGTSSLAELSPGQLREVIKQFGF